MSDLPVLFFPIADGGGRIVWRLGDPHVTRHYPDGASEQFTEWWPAWRDHPTRRSQLSVPARSTEREVLLRIARGARYYGAEGMSLHGDDHLFIHLMEHVLACAQPNVEGCGESAHSVHRQRGGYGPFWYTVWAVLHGLPAPTPPPSRGCCYPVSNFGPAVDCEACGGTIAAASADDWFAALVEAPPM